MEKLKRVLLEGVVETAPPEVEEFPLPVAEDWDDVLRRATRVADVIDRHLDFESKLQGRSLSPLTLCPEQRASLAADLNAVV